MTDDIEFRHRRFQGPVELHYVETGEGPLVVFLHGFPEFWYSWRHQLRAFADAGYRAVAPDMRGYNLSGKPDGLESYTREKLTGDVAALIEHLGADRAMVVGHDWGGVVSWLFAMDHPEQLSKLGILNCPHPVSMAEGMKDWGQMFRAIHMLFFQAPVLPEFVLRSGDFALIRRIFRRDPVRENAFSDSDIDRYVEALAEPGALTGSLNYYRSASRNGLVKPVNEIDDPVRIIWGRRDRFLRADLARPPENLVRHADVEYLYASHWIQVDRPNAVNERLLEFARPE